MTPAALVAIIVVVPLIGAVAVHLDHGGLPWRTARSAARWAVYSGVGWAALAQTSGLWHVVPGHRAWPWPAALVYATYAQLTQVFEPREQRSGWRRCRLIRTLAARLLADIDGRDAPGDDVAREQQRRHYALNLIDLFGDRAADELLHRFKRSRFELTARAAWCDEISQRLPSESRLARVEAALDLLRKYDDTYYRSLPLRIGDWQREVGLVEPSRADLGARLDDPDSTIEATAVDQARDIAQSRRQHGA